MLQTIRNIFKIEDLRKRIIYTLLMLALVRLGALIPSPLMNAEVVKTYFASANSVMQLFDIMSEINSANKTAIIETTTKSIIKFGV